MITRSPKRRALGSRGPRGDVPRRASTPQRRSTLFGILDTLRAGSDDLLAAARTALGAAKGASALEPWNLSYAMAGDLQKELAPCAAVS